MTGLAACAALAVLELDAVLVAQTLVSRPFVVGAVIGALGGRAHTGALYGAAFELLALVDVPVGGSLTWSASVASGTAAALMLGGTSAAMCFAGGLGAGLLHARLEAVERARRTAGADALAAAAESGGPALGRAFAVSIALHAAGTFALSLAVVALVGWADRFWWPYAPEVLRAAASAAASCAPWIGLSGVAAWGLSRA
ncbi:MAG: hypothetical protein M0D55_19555 [Elusimicrobiota bacterium]|nr:MAG: hypothetical protein M0D55_19555 [Elusimicrobiota bacterium]